MTYRPTWDGVTVEKFIGERDATCRRFDAATSGPA
jgi:hypothetical protein